MSNVICECCVPSCKSIGKAEKTVHLIVVGWKGLKVSKFWQQRTHTGWCPDCAKKFRVKEE